MLVEQRYQKILDLMQEDGSVRVSRLKQEMDVSSETIRRDLENMEAQGLIRRTRGGAFLNVDKKSDQESSAYTPFGTRDQEKPENKEQIAEYALHFIQEGQSIALDSGTTAFALAKAIKKHFHSLTVVTNSWAIINELSDAEGITVIATGGVFNREEKAFISDMAGMIFSKLSINTFFLTTCGISVDKGITYQRMNEIIVQEKMMEASADTIIIADSSKLGVNSLVKMCDVDKISMIITDSEASAEQIEPFVKAGIRVEQA
ncbi:MAG: DeoR/GlpR family DNA-binding transcription regulator [Lachnospiraceae bacterium]|nr:DeoR/GlpR family DNA-binding transcription regulator [Lachnospiraceae bacterium]